MSETFPHIVPSGVDIFPYVSGTQNIGTISNPFNGASFISITGGNYYVPNSGIANLGTSSNALGAVYANTISGLYAPPFLSEDPFFRYNHQPLLNWVNNLSTVLTVGVAGAGNYGTWDGENFWIGAFGNHTITQVSQNGVILNSYSLGTSIHPLQLAWDNRYIWVGSADTSGTLIKFDPQAGSIVNSYILNPSGLGAGGIQGVIWDGANIWAGVAQSGYTGVNAGMVVKVDPSSGSVLQTTYGQTNVNGMAALDIQESSNVTRYIFAANNGFIGKINASNGTSTRINTPGNTTYRICTDGYYIYGADFFNNAVYKILPSSGSVVATWATATSPNSIEFDGRNVWVVGNGISNGGSTYIHNRDTGVPVISTTGIGINGLVFDGSYMWNVDTNQYVYKIFIGEVAGNLKSYNSFSVMNTGNQVAFNFSTVNGMLDFHGNNITGIVHIIPSGGLSSGEWLHLDGAVAEGATSTAAGTAAHAEGYQTVASQPYAHSEGYQSQAIASYAHAEGYASITNGAASHAEGFMSAAGGQASHAEGQGTSTFSTALGSHAEGWNTQANGIASHSEGLNTFAVGDYSHAGGINSSGMTYASFARGAWAAANGYASVAIAGWSGNAAASGSWVFTDATSSTSINNTANSLLMRFAGGVNLNSGTTLYAPVISGTVISGSSIYQNGVLVSTEINPTITTPSGIALWSGTSGLGMLNSPIVIDATQGDLIIPPSGDLWVGYKANNFTLLPSGLTHITQYDNLLIQEAYVNFFGTNSSGASFSDATIDIENRGSGTFNYPEIALDRSRFTGNFQNPGVTNYSVSGIIAGDNMGHLGWWGSSDISGDYVNGGYIRAIAAENFNNASGSVRMQFATNETGTVNLITRMEIGPSGSGFVGTSAAPFGSGVINQLNTINLTGTNLYANNSILLNASGSTTAAPKVFGFSNFLPNTAVQLQFGDANTVIQNGNGFSMDISAFHTIRLAGATQFSGLGALNEYSTQSAYGTQVVNTYPTIPAFVVTAGSGQTASLTEWHAVNDTSTLSKVDSNGNHFAPLFSGTVFSGVTANALTFAMPSGGAITVAVSGTGIGGGTIGSIAAPINTIWTSAFYETQPIYAQIGITGNATAQLATQHTVFAASGTWSNINSSPHFTIATSPASITYTGSNAIVGMVTANAVIQAGSVALSGTLSIWKNAALASANTSIQTLIGGTGSSVVSTEWIGPIATNDKFQMAWATDTAASAVTLKMANLSFIRLI